MISKILNFTPKDELFRLQELRSAMDQFALTAVIQDTGFLVDANEKFLQVLGFAHEEIFKTPFSTLLSGQMRGFFSEQVLPIIRRGITWRGEICHTARNGKILWTEATIVPLLSKLDNLSYFHYIAFEITERKAVETALAESSLFSTRLMELAPVGFFLADQEGHCTYINKMWCELSGRSLKHAIGNGWIEAVFASDRPMVEEAWALLVNLGKSFHCEYRYLHASGEVVWVESAGERVSFTIDAQPRYIRIENNLTERKETEKLIAEQRAQMFTAFKMSALGEMAGGIAHEINNPLAILQLRAKQIELLAKPNVTNKEQLIAAAESIHSTTGRIAAIVRALRAIARDGSRDPFVSTPVKSLIADTLELCAARFQQHDINLTVKSFADSLEISCRPAEILQILLNLLNNALAAVENLSEKWVEVSVYDGGETLQISVTDSGLGIPIPMQERIFQPFVTTKPVGSGTGLGLSICKALALDHSGDLSLDDRCPNTRFVLTLPKEPNIELEQKEAASEHH